MRKLVLGLLVLIILFFFGCSGMKNGGIQQWISKNPNDAAALNNIGANHYATGQYQEAIDYYKKAIRIKPDMAEAHYNLGVAYEELGHYGQATASYKEAIRIKPDMAEAHYNLGVAYEKLGHYGQATASYKEAIRINPDNVWANFSLGTLYFIQGKLNKALAHIKKANRIMPNEPLILGQIGYLYLEQDEPKKSIEILKQAVNINPASSKLDIIKDDTIPQLTTELYGNLSAAYEKLKRYDDAIKTAKKALEIEYGDPTANLVLGLSYDGKGDGLNAISHMITAVNKFEELQTTDKRQVGLNKRIIQISLTKSKKKLREFYSKYDFSPEEFGSDGIATAPRIPRLPEAAPSEEQTPQSGSGSGFFVSKMGHVITNAHVVQNCKNITIGDNANKQVPAEVINTDRSNDLALLKLSSLEMASAESKSLIQKLNIAVVPLASKGLLRSEDVRLGEKVLVAGYPFGDVFSDTIKVTSGIVSATRGSGDDSGQFQLDAAVQPGNSGGPIYDSGGNIVGVVISQLDKMKMAKTIGSMPENVNFGIKASTVRQFLISSGVPSKKSEQTEEKSTEQLAKIAKNQALMVMCLQ